MSSQLSSQYINITIWAYVFPRNSYKSVVFPVFSYRCPCRSYIFSFSCRFVCLDFQRESDLLKKKKNIQESIIFHAMDLHTNLGFHPPTNRKLYRVMRPEYTALPNRNIVLSKYAINHSKLCD